MSRYIFLILILGFVGGGHSKSQANSDVSILQSYVSVYTDGQTIAGRLDVKGDYQSGYRILIKGGGVGDLPSYGWRFYKWSNLLKKEIFCYNKSNTHYIGKLKIKDSWWSHYGAEIDFDTLYYNGTDITWEFDIPAYSWGRWDCYGSIIGDIFMGDNNIYSTSATISGGFHVILPNPPTTITMPTVVTLKGLVNKIEKTKNGYEVEIIEYLEDYFEEPEDFIATDTEENNQEGFNIPIKNLSGEKIFTVKNSEGQSKIVEELKSNIDKFSKKKITLEKGNDKIYITKVE